MGVSTVKDSLPSVQCRSHPDNIAVSHYHCSHLHALVVLWERLTISNSDDAARRSEVFDFTGVGFGITANISLNLKRSMTGRSLYLTLNDG